MKNTFDIEFYDKTFHIGNIIWMKMGIELYDPYRDHLYGDCYYPLQGSLNDKLYMDLDECFYFSKKRWTKYEKYI